MIEQQLFEGEQFRLSGYDPDKDLEVEAAYTYDLDYVRHFRRPILRPFSIFELRKFHEKELKKIADSPVDFYFTVRSKADDHMVGFMILNAGEWIHRVGQIRLAIGDRSVRQQAAAEALRMALNYGFTELNLYRMEIQVPEYDFEILDILERLRFMCEVRRRETLWVNDRYWDILIFGILQKDWQQTDEVRE